MISTANDHEIPYGTELFQGIGRYGIGAVSMNTHWHAAAQCSFQGSTLCVTECKKQKEPDMSLFFMRAILATILLLLHIVSRSTMTPLSSQRSIPKF
jgi:hypothetical protein